MRFLAILLSLVAVPCFAGTILDDNGNEYFSYSVGATPKNYIDIYASNTNQNPQFTAKGDDANIGISFQGKGDWFHAFHATSSREAIVRLYENETNGNSAVGLSAAPAIGTTYDILLPTGIGSVGDSIVIDSISGSKAQMAFSAASGSGGIKPVVLTTQYDATTTTLGSSDLSHTLSTGKKYTFRSVLYIDASAGGGHKVAIGGTVTPNGDFKYQTTAVSGATLLYSDRKTTIEATSAQTGATTVMVTIEGSCNVTTGGSLVVRFAQNAASGTSSILRGSTFEVLEAQ